VSDHNSLSIHFFLSEISKVKVCVLLILNSEVRASNQVIDCKLVGFKFIVFDKL
jgi:hypothetical protein